MLTASAWICASSAVVGPQDMLYLPTSLRDGDGVLDDACDEHDEDAFYGVDDGDEHVCEHYGVYAL